MNMIFGVFVMINQAYITRRLIVHSNRLIISLYSTLKSKSNRPKHNDDFYCDIIGLSIYQYLIVLVQRAIREAVSS